MDDFEIPKEIRLKIAEDLAEDRLELINSRLEDVIPKRTFYTRFVKRLFDIVASFVFLLLTLPFNLVFAVITYFDVGCPILFRQERVGKDGKSFEIIKFRNMREDIGKNGELLPPDQRVTKFGSFMRKTSCDELLNFWSILKGDMSLIGPRPLLPEYTYRYNKRHIMRLAAKPGLECPSWKRLDHVWTWQEQLDNDVWYVENVSFWVDCKMIVKLALFALDQKNASARVNAKRGIFMGYSENGTAVSMDQVDDAYLERYGIFRDQKDKRTAEKV